MTKIRFDDWAQTNGALGSNYDRSEGLTFSRRSRLSRAILDALYEQSAIIARVIDLIVDDSLRNDWEIRNAKPIGGGSVDLAAFRLRMDRELGGSKNVNAHLGQSLKWSRLYGGGALLTPTKQRAADPGAPLGGLDLSQPLVLPSIEALGSVAPATAYDVTPYDYDTSLGSRTFRQVIHYDVQNVDLYSGQRRVHHSRLIPFEPVPLPVERAQASPTGWGPSVLERVFDSYARAGAGSKHASGLLFVQSLLYLKLHGYRDMHKTADGRSKLRAFLETFAAKLSAQGIAAIDTADDLANVSHNLSGARDVLDHLDRDFAAHTDMPREILYNESPAGLNAGELSGPQSLWFAKCGQYQEHVIEPAIRRLVDLCAHAWGTPFESFEIAWNPLWVKSEDAQADTYSKNAAADRSYFEIGAVSEAEIRAHRFEQGRADPIEVVAPGDESDALDLGLAESEIEAYEAASVGETEKPADAVLNGAQIQSLVAIVEKVAAGLLPRDSAIEIVRVAFPTAAGRAEALLGSAGLAAPAPAAPAAPAVTAEEDQEAAPSSAPAPDDLISPRDAAQKFGVPTVALTRLIRSGALPYWGIGAHKRVSLAEVAELAKAHEAPPLDLAEEPPAGDDPI